MHLVSRLATAARPPLLRFACVLGLALAITHPVHAAPPDAPADPAWLRQELDTFRAAHKLPAIAVAVVQDGKIVAASTVGLRRQGARHSTVRPDERFQVGDIARVGTATLLARLVDNGRLSWSDKVEDMFPEFVDKNLQRSYGPATLGDLLTHTAGFTATPGMPADTWDADAGALHRKRLDYTEAALKEAPAQGPDVSVIESPTSSIVAATYAESVTRGLYEDLMAREVFKPLGMHTARFGAPATEKVADRVANHVVRSGKVLVVEALPADAARRVGAPAGANMACSIADLARFAAAHLPGPEARAPYLAPDTLVWLRTPATVGPAQTPAGVTPAWRVATPAWARGPVLTADAGANRPYFAVVHLVPDEKVAICIATNLGDDAVAAAGDALSAQLLQAIRDGRFTAR